METTSRQLYRTIRSIWKASTRARWALLLAVPMLSVSGSPMKDGCPFLFPQGTFKTWSALVPSPTGEPMFWIQDSSGVLCKVAWTK